MKQLTALQQQNRRSNSFRGGTSPLDGAVEGGKKSPVTIFWLILHGLCCLISLVLGFRFSRLLFFLLFSTSSSTLPPSATTFTALHASSSSSEATTPTPKGNFSTGGGSRVVVGRHGILIRPWPHPDPAEVMKAHKIIERVQIEQRSLYGIKTPKPVIVITPTYVRTFQTLHLTGVMHSLMNVPYDLIWIVVEAGRVTNETASLISKSGLETIHIGFDEKMPVLWEDRHKLESRMRLHALRWIIDPPLEITVPAKRTPWPDSPPELPSFTEKVHGIQESIPENTERRAAKVGLRRKRTQNKKKHTTKVLNEHVTITRHSEDN